MPKPRSLKRNNLMRKKSLGAFGKGIGIAALAWAAAFGGADLIKKQNAQKAQKARQEEIQREGYQRRLNRLVEEKEKKKEVQSEAQVKAIKYAIKKGMLPRVYTKEDGSSVIVDYIDPPSGKGVKRSKPVETLQAELIRKELKRKGN